MRRRLPFVLRVLAILVPLLAVPRADAGPVTVAVAGDSLSASYTGHPYGTGNQSWTDLIGSQRPGQVQLFNFAAPGATSTDLLTQGQHTSIAGVVQNDSGPAGTMPYAAILIGSNDVGAFIQALMQGQNPSPAALVAGVVDNVKTALDTVQAAGKVGVVIGNVPDLTKTPYFQQALAGQTAVAQSLTALTQAINAGIEQLARQRGVPVVDLYGLNNLPTDTAGPLLMGGYDVKSLMYGVDGFHPSTLGQGLIYNTVFEAFNRAYGLDVSNLLLSDNELLTAQGHAVVTGNQDRFDVSGFVHYQTPEPSGLCLLAVGGAVLAWRRAARRL